MPRIDISPDIVAKKKFHNRASVLNNAAQGYWPKSYLKIFQTLREIPLASLAAIAGTSGFALTWAYARSLDFNADPAVLATHGALVAAISLLLFILLGIYLIFPSLVTNIFGLSQVSRWFNLSSQLVGLSFIFLAVYYAEYVECRSPLNAFTVICYAVFIFSSVKIIEEIFEEKFWLMRGSMLAASVLIGLSSWVTFIIIYFYSNYILEKNDISVFYFFGSLLAVVFINTAITVKSVHKIIATALFMAMLFLVLVPMMLQQSSKTLNLIASASGIRENSFKRLKLTKEACTVIAPVVMEIKGKILNCNEHYVEHIDAQILFGIGSDWLVELALPETTSSPRVLSIPSKGIQIEYVRKKVKQPRSEKCV
jgi:hypothetical protein